MRRHDRACWIWLLVSASLLAGMVEPAGAGYYGRHGRYYRPYPYWTQKKHVRQVKVYGADGSARISLVTVR